MAPQDESGEARTFSALSPGGEELFGRIPIWLNTLGGLVLAVMLCLLLFL
ncbi:hypothetical protein HUT06_00610 [Actinomadura sp. NAK00032]|nr:hypothetical protein [Actinomadura sp. NAK00032]QKW32716.1 hypothetical protein HUT06_00610 [Actinomadura sp. NAK00032]